MILIREWFVAKPGQASKLAALIKEAQSAAPYRVRVMTDLTGEFNRVVMETELEDLAALDARMKDYETNKDLRNAMKGYTELYIGGGREILRIL